MKRPPRHTKTPSPLSAKMKSVRVNKNTVIQVSIDITDEDAILRYQQRTTLKPDGKQSSLKHPMRKEECYEEIESDDGIGLDEIEFKEPTEADFDGSDYQNEEGDD